MTLPSFLTSAAFWSALAGAAAVVCGAVDPGGSLGNSVQTLLEAVGGVLIAVPTHHVVAAQQAAKTTTAAIPPPPPAPPVA